MTAPAERSQSPETTHLPPWATAALLIAVVTLVARILGLIRFAVLSRTVGTGCLGDVYATANAVPNIVYEVVVGGAFVALVVPLVAGVGEKEPGKVRATVAALHGWALVLLVPITALMYVTSTLVIDLLLGSASGCPSNASSVATDMLWVFLLQIPIYGATVVAQGSLQAHHRFFAPAVAPAVSSLVVIGSYFVYDAMAGEHHGSLGELTSAEFWVLAGGTTLGVVALLLVQVPALARAKLIVKPSLKFPEGRAGHAWTLAWSGGVVVASQWVAYAAAIRWSNVYGDEGSALVFVISWTLFLVPWAILALPIATSTFPRLSVLHARHDRVGAATITASSLRTVIWPPRLVPPALLQPLSRWPSCSCRVAPAVMMPFLSSQRSCSRSHPASLRMACTVIWCECLLLGTTHPWQRLRPSWAGRWDWRWRGLRFAPLTTPLRLPEASVWDSASAW